MKTSPTPVVSDADVLIHLAKLGRLPLLRALYERVSIPERTRKNNFKGQVLRFDISLLFCYFCVMSRALRIEYPGARCHVTSRVITLLANTELFGI